MDSFFSALPKNTTLMIHSSLKSIGKDINLDEFLNRLIQLGNEGSTIVLPTFSFSFAQTGVYDVDNTPSENGKLTELFRQKEGVKRTLNPMQSLAIYGKNQDKYLASQSETTFGEDSIFEMMLEDDAYIILLGVDFNKTTFYHYPEEKFCVPYRFWKEFKGSVKDKQVSKEVIYKMFVRELEYMPNINHYGLLMQEKNLVKSFNFHNAIVRMFKVKDLYKLLKSEIFRDPYCLVNTDRDVWEIGVTNEN